MHENIFATGHAISAPEQIVRRQSLQHQGGGLRVGNSLRNLDQSVGLDVANFAVGTRFGIHIGDAIADAEAAHLTADRGNDAGRFAS